MADSISPVRTSTRPSNTSYCTWDEKDHSHYRHCPHAGPEDQLHLLHQLRLLHLLHLHQLRPLHLLHLHQLRLPHLLHLHQLHLLHLLRLHQLRLHLLHLLRLHQLRLHLLHLHQLRLRLRLVPYAPHAELISNRTLIPAPHRWTQPPLRQHLVS
jgi:hypothetical protein